ncbi:MAG: hypothetical protein R6V83_01045 [Candidatus Thorarchaeota archaeon]
MRETAIVFCLILTGYLVILPATQFEPVTYSDDGVSVSVSIETETPWITPFDEFVNVSVQVVPGEENVSQTNITRVSLFVHTSEGDSGDLVLAATSNYEESPIASGESSADVNYTFRMKGSQSGSESYFSLSVQGSYRNESGIYPYHALSSETLIGPFRITRGIYSIQSLVGIAVAAVSTILIAIAIIAFRRSQKPKRRKTLLEE